VGLRLWRKLKHRLIKENGIERGDVQAYDR
jgi:hypothetical protein